MTWRSVQLVCVLVVGGCWTDDLVDGQFTPEQWAHLQHEFTLPFPIPAADPQRAALGQALFFDPGMSGPSGQVSCATCHDPNGWMIDTRTPNNVSAGNGKITKRNSMSVVSSWLKNPLGGLFTSTGGFVRATGEVVTLATAGSVTDLAVTGPMASSHQIVVNLITISPTYSAQFTNLFGSLAMDTPDQIFVLVENVIDEYIKGLTSWDSPFDHYIAGDDTAISDEAKRGFGVFVGRGMCIECHSGPLLSDLQFHNTGVPQIGANVPAIDLGRGAITKDDNDNGKFLTGTLRQIAQTGSYMHDGAFATLADVIAFYRQGGVTGGYSGTKDPRIVPADFTDDDAHDLEAFLGTLTGAPIAAQLAKPPGICWGYPHDLMTDPQHCGSCTKTCASNMCMAGKCVP